MTINTKTVMILLALLGGVVGVSTSTWGVISLADSRYASSTDLSHTKLVVEEHILESKQILLNGQLTNILIKLTDSPTGALPNSQLMRLKGEVERALAPINIKLEDVRERLRLGKP